MPRLRLLALSTTLAAAVAFAQEPAAPAARAASGFLQLRGGAIGGNPVQVFLTGGTNAYARTRSGEPLDMGAAVEREEPFLYWTDSLRVPAGHTFLLRRAQWRGRAVGDGNGSGPVEVRVGRSFLLERDPAPDAFEGRWQGELRVPHGFEHTVSLTLSNSSCAEVAFEGVLVVDETATWPTPAMRARVRALEAALPRVTLLARSKHESYESATFSFQHGLRDDPELAVTRNDWDVQFGNGRDEFGVQMVTDDRSQIADLGELRWADLLVDRDVPVFDDAVAAAAGHIYYVHTLDRDTDAEALFRVVELVPGDQVVLEWLLVDAVQIQR